MFCAVLQFSCSLMMAAEEVNKAVGSMLAILPNTEQLNSEQEERLRHFIAGKDVVFTQDVCLAKHQQLGKIRSNHLNFNRIQASSKQSVSFSDPPDEAKRRTRVCFYQPVFLIRPQNQSVVQDKSTMFSKDLGMTGGKCRETQREPGPEPEPRVQICHKLRTNWQQESDHLYKCHVLQYSQIISLFNSAPFC